MEEELSGDDAPALATLNAPNVLNAPNAPNAPNAETLTGCQRVFDLQAKGKAPSTSPSHIRRRRRRNAVIDRDGQRPRKKTIQEAVRPQSSLQTKLSTEALPATACGYRAMNGSFNAARKLHTTSGLLAQGFQLISWDGLCVTVAFSQLNCADQRRQ
jgi:hypothetical protein